MKIFIFLILILCSTINAAEYECNAAEYECSSLSFCENTRLDVDYSFGKLIGLREGYAEIGLFFPVFISQELFSFLDVRGFRFDDSKWGSSAGIGIRKNYSNYGMVGANIYYDCRQGKFHKGFQGLGLGLEWLSPCWDVRINGYLPVGKRVHQSNRKFFDYIGDFKASVREKEFCFNEGFDAELGAPLVCYGDFDLYGAAGPYYYRAKSRTQYWGGQGRLELNWRSFLSLQVRTSYDRKNHCHSQGRVSLTIPFDFFYNGQCFEKICENIWMQRVERNGIIFTDSCCSYKWNW